MTESAEASTKTTTSDKSEEDSVANLTKLFHETKVEDGGTKKSVWSMTAETFGMADGQDHHTDDTTEDLAEAMVKLLELISKESSKHAKWGFETVPVKEFNVTMDDVYKAFLIWSNKKEGDEPKLYNITKSFKRLDHYATWMHDNAKDLAEPLTAESIAKAHDVWKLKITHDASSRLIWWVDMGSIDLKTMKETLSPTDSLRYFVWQAHLIMLNSKAQENGLMFVEAMGKIGMWDAFTMVPMEVGTKLDRLTIGSLPIKMKAFYMFNGAKWMHIMLALMRPFMSQKMRQRIICTSAKDDPQSICDKEFGRECIPRGFGGMEGGTLKDLIESKYVKSETFA